MRLDKKDSTKLSKLLVAMLILFSAATKADTAICSGGIKRIGYHAPDGFFLELDGLNMIKVCSPKETFFRTSPESCMLLVTLATTARATGKSLQVYIDNAPSSLCEDVPPWFEADVRFVELLK